MLREMLGIYCKKKHHCSTGLCRECEELYQYAAQRVEHCPRIETKTFCSSCEIHCYKKEMRERIREVMKFSGPRLLFVHPVMAVRHMADTIQKKRRQR